MQSAICRAGFLTQRFVLGALAAALTLSACEFGGAVPTQPDARLASGLYDYRAWSDFDTRGPAWEGTIRLWVETAGRVRGEYRLPGQCRDGFGRLTDCVGRIGGRLERSGRLSFGLDEGWLRNRGVVQTRQRVTGAWDANLVGYADEGTFELVFRSR